MSDVSGVAYIHHGVPVNGGSGTKAGATDNGPGKLLVDVTNKVVYVNSNTAASPTWLAIGSAELATFLTNVPTAAIAQVAAANVVGAAGANPTQAEYATVVTLLNEVKLKLNTLLTQIGSGAGGAGILT